MLDLGKLLPIVNQCSSLSTSSKLKQHSVPKAKDITKWRDCVMRITYSVSLPNFLDYEHYNVLKILQWKLKLS